MKRSWEDGCMTSQLKRPEPSGQAQMMGGMAKLTTNDALAYLKAVKEMFPDRRDKYDEFLDVMKDFKAQRLDTSGVIARVKELFKGHRHLILGFNAFLPKGYEIVLPPENEAHAGGKKPIDFHEAHAGGKKPIDFHEAINFVNKIKARFHGDDQVYKSFLDILNLYRKENKSIQEVYREVASLFCDHRDLLVEFTHFLPDYSAEASVRHAQSARNSTMGRDGRGPPMSMARMRNVDKDLAGDWPDRRRAKLLMRTDKDHQRLFKEESTRIQDYPHKRKCAKAEDLLAELFCKGKHDQELAFCEKVKDRLESDDYQEFMKCLHIYMNSQITDSQLRKLVFNLLKDHPDMVEEFDKFKTQFDKLDFSTQLKVENKDRDMQLELDTRYRDFDDRDKDRSDEGLGFASKDIVGQRTSLYSSKDKYFTKPIQELDLSHCESCTPSYRLLPNNYPIPLASQRTKMGSEVLNDHWVSVTSGSEDYSFKHMRRNQYEESLFRCEDDMFDLDMLLASVNSAARRVEELLEKIDNDSGPFCVEEHFSDLNLRCIERLYGEHGLDVLDVLRKNASLALPVILTRLKQKQEEWSKCRSDFNKVWADIYSKNYHKSLDHRSFYFKQQDTKSLSIKVLLAEIKEISDNRSQEDDMLGSFVTGKRPPVIPHLEFEYPDPGIHEDLSKLIKYACQEVCASEQLDEVIKIWTHFLEPMLGVASQPQAQEDMEDVVNSISDKAKCVNNGARDGNGIPAGTGTGSVSSGTGDESIPNGTPSGNAVEGVKDGDSHYASVEPKTDNLIDTPQRETVLNASSMADATSGGGTLATCTGPQENVTVNMENISETSTLVRPSNGNVDGGFETKTSDDSQGGECTRPLLASPVLAPELKTEREEGELSPNSDFEEDNFTACGDTSKESAGNPKDDSGNGQHQMPAGVRETCDAEAGEIDANANANANANDECAESAHRLSEESENTSENGDASGHESAGGEECPMDEPHDNKNQDAYGCKVENECEVEGMDDDEQGDGNGAFQPFTEPLLQTAKPITRWIAQSPNRGHDSQIFYGNDSFYVLFRLHYILYERIRKAKLYSITAENKRRNANDNSSLDSYAQFMNALHNLLDGSSDNAKFEDDCRALIGTQSYLLFTLDKLVFKLVKQLQNIATDDMSTKLLQLHAYERSRKPETFIDYCYGENAHVLLFDQNIYRLECMSAPTRLSIQMMDYWFDKPDATAVAVDPDFADYMCDLLAVAPERPENPRIFLRRNMHKYAHLDESSAFFEAAEGLLLFNGLEVKVSCSSSKASYVLGSEDVLIRRKKRRKVSHQNRSFNGQVSSNGVPMKKLMFS